MTLPQELRSKQGLEEWAGRYLETYLEADRAIQEMVCSARSRRTHRCTAGHLTTAELIEIAKWMKASRNLHNLRSNREFEVKERSGRAFEDKDHEPLEHLKGVKLRTSTVIMHFAFPKLYPIFSGPALSALGIDPSDISPKLWHPYQKNCLAWRKEYGVCLRTLDRALWQYGKGW